MEMFIRGEWMKKLWYQKCPGRKELRGHQKTRRKQSICLRERSLPETLILWDSNYLIGRTKAKAGDSKESTGLGEND